MPRRREPKPIAPKAAKKKAAVVPAVASELVILTGLSGSGKSTLLNILGCLDHPSSGEYRLDGKNVANSDDKQLSRIRNANIGFIFQSFNLLPRRDLRDRQEFEIIPIRPTFLLLRVRLNRSR